MPSVDLEDRGKDFHLTVDLPGFKKEDVEIEVTDDSLTVHAQKTQSEEEKKKNYVRHERASQSFYRQKTTRTGTLRRRQSKPEQWYPRNHVAQEGAERKEEAHNRRRKKYLNSKISQEPKHAQGHSTVITQLESGEFMCPECGKPFDVKEAAEKHLHTIHLKHLRAMHKEYHEEDVAGLHVE
jgi:hypothetical protein